MGNYRRGDAISPFNTDRYQMDLARFTTLQIKRMISEGGEYRYQKNLDRVIFDITGYSKLASKVRFARTMRELLFVYRTFGFEHLELFRESKLADALQDLILMDNDIRKVQQRMNKAKKKGHKPDKDDIKFHDKIAKLYRKTVKVIREELQIRTHGSSKFYKDNYKSAKSLIRKESNDEFNEFYFDSLYDEEFGSSYRKDSVDYFDEYMRKMDSVYRAPRKPFDEDDDDMFDLNLEQSQPSTPYTTDPALLNAITNLGTKMDQLGSLMAASNQTPSKHVTARPSRAQVGSQTPSWVTRAKMFANANRNMSDYNRHLQDYTDTDSALFDYINDPSTQLPVGYSGVHMNASQTTQQKDPTELSSEEFKAILNSQYGQESANPVDPENLSREELIAILNARYEQEAANSGDQSIQSAEAISPTPQSPQDAASPQETPNP